jgi:hypothetical protein
MCACVREESIKDREDAGRKSIDPAAPATPTIAKRRRLRCRRRRCFGDRDGRSRARAEAVRQVLIAPAFRQTGSSSIAPVASSRRRQRDGEGRLANRRRDQIVRCEVGD